MEEKLALDAYSALSHATRLAVFRLLVKAGPDGMPAGDIAEALDARQNTMSSHLKLLQAAQLVSSHRDGRCVYYRARFDTVRELVLFLMEDCCRGHADVCRPVAESLALRC